VQGLAKGLGIEQRIISPTFIIMRSYQVPDYSSSEAKPNREVLDFARTINFYHVDLYRIETERDVEGLGLFDLIGDPENIMVIEWPEKIEHLLPVKRIDLAFKYLDEDKREIKFL
jgi:tRNA threonylcarbamoyladenosine biosynthesis protein TsaE